MDNEHARILLAEARTRVETALENAGEPDDSLDTDIAGDPDGAANLRETGVDDAVVVSLREDLAAIDRAEQRLADGTYGRSVVSGDPIPDARLEAAPWAERTVEEQARYEQGG